jgi:hypothetical protein
MKDHNNLVTGSEIRVHDLVQEFLGFGVSVLIKSPVFLQSTWGGRDE